MKWNLCRIWSFLRARDLISLCQIVIKQGQHVFWGYMTSLFQCANTECKNWSRICWKLNSAAVLFLKFIYTRKAWNILLAKPYHCKAFLLLLFLSGEIIQGITSRLVLQRLWGLYGQLCTCLQMLFQVDLWFAVNANLHTWTFRLLELHTSFHQNQVVGISSAEPLNKVLAQQSV